MKSFEIKGVQRKDVGKKFSKQLRKENLIPCVLYGGENNIHFQAPENDFHLLIYTPNVYLINLDIDGVKYMAILKEIQFHPVTDKVIHIDFLEIKDDKKIKILIPIQFDGFAAGVRTGGKLYTMMRRLRVMALPKDLPDVLNINIEEMELGSSVKIKDLDFENIELLDRPNSVVCAVKLTRVAKGMTIEEEETVEVEGEEGEEAEGEDQETTDTKEETSERSSEHKR